MGRFAGMRELANPGSVTSWVRRLRDRVRPEYVDYADIPDGPVSPYRARLAVAAVRDDGGEDLSAREVVRGTVKIIFQVRCPCGRRWFNRRKESVQCCPRCGRAVLLLPAD